MFVIFYYEFQTLVCDSALPLTFTTSTIAILHVLKAPSREKFNKLMRQLGKTLKEEKNISCDMPVKEIVYKYCCCRCCSNADGNDADIDGDEI